MSNKGYNANFINRQSFIELDARERATALFDAGTSRELLGPFDRMESPWLPMQGVTPQADDGCVVMKGKIAGQAAVVVALEGAFQGGSIGEVSGEKMTAALDLACADNEKGIPTSSVILLETGGVRLQEANLGLAAIAELMASILVVARCGPGKLRRYDARSSTRNERSRGNRAGERRRRIRLERSRTHLGNSWWGPAIRDGLGRRTGR